MKRSTRTSELENVPSAMQIVKLEMKAKRGKKMIKSPNIFHAMNFYCNNFSVQRGGMRRWGWKYNMQTIKVIK